MLSKGFKMPIVKRLLFSIVAGVSSKVRHSWTLSQFVAIGALLLASATQVSAESLPLAASVSSVHRPAEHVFRAPTYHRLIRPARIARRDETDFLPQLIAGQVAWSTLRSISADPPRAGARAVLRVPAARFSNPGVGHAPRRPGHGPRPTDYAARSSITSLPSAPPSPSELLRSRARAWEWLAGIGLATTAGYLGDADPQQRADLALGLGPFSALGFAIPDPPGRPTSRLVPSARPVSGGVIITVTRGF